MKKHTKFYTLVVAVVMIMSLMVMPAFANQGGFYSDILAEPDGLWALDPEYWEEWEEKERYLYPFSMAFREALGENIDSEDWYSYGEILERGEELDDPAFQAYKAYKEAYNAWERMNADVTISASASGVGGMVTVTVTFGPDGVIKALDVSAPNETPMFGGRAAESGYTSMFIGVSSGDDVDSLSGATVTSTAVKDAVNDAVKAFKESKSDNISAVEEPTSPAANTASPSTQTVNVDGKAVEFAMYALNGGSTNYIRVRDLAVVLNGTSAQFNVGWNGNVTLTSKTRYDGATDKAPFATPMAYTDYTNHTYVDGKAVDLEAIQIEYNGGGFTYYKLRDLAQALNFNVGWSADKGIFVETNKPYDPND